MNGRTMVTKLTTAAAGLSDVVHDIAFLQEKTKSIVIFITSSVSVCQNDETVIRLNVLTVRPGSPSGPGPPCQMRRAD